MTPLYGSRYLTLQCSKDLGGLSLLNPCLYFLVFQVQHLSGLNYPNGSPYAYTDAFIQWLQSFISFGNSNLHKDFFYHLSYRESVGVFKKHTPKMNYTKLVTTVCERMKHFQNSFKYKVFVVGRWWA